MRCPTADTRRPRVACLAVLTMVFTARAAAGEGMTLDVAMERAWNAHPRMRAVRASMAASEQQAVVAALWPDPTLAVSAGREEDRKTALGASLAQRLELGGKRAARMDASAADTFARHADALAAWAGVRADVKEAFARCLHLEDREACARELAAAASQRRDLLRALVAAGRIPRDETAEDETAAARHAADLAALAAAREDAERRLALAVGAAPGMRLDAEGDGPPLQGPGPAEAERLLAAAGERGPRTAAARALAAAAAARARAVRAARWSDPAFEIRYTAIDYDGASDGSGAEYGAGLAIGLPLRNRTRADVEAARSAREAAEHGVAVAENDTAAALSEWMAEGRRAVLEHACLRDTALPEHAAAAELAGARFREGRTDALPWLTARIRLAETRQAIADAAWRSRLAAIRLEEAAAVLDDLRPGTAGVR